MGGACSRKQEGNDEDNLSRGFSKKYCKCGSLKWWTSSFSYPSMDLRTQKGECPSLLDLCVQKISEVLSNFMISFHCSSGLYILV